MAALWLLIRLKWRASQRKLFSGMKTVKGALLGLFAIGFVAMVLLPNLIVAMSKGADDHREVFEYAPFLLLVYLLSNLLTSMGERTIYFTPAEACFLFPAPFTRRQLLIYKLFGIFVTSMLMAMLMTCAMALFFPSLLFGFYGMLMTMIFVTLMGMVITLIGQIVVEKTYTNVRRLLALGILAGLGLAMGQALGNVPEVNDMLQWVRQISASGVGSVLLFPFRIFTDTAGARSWQAFMFWAPLATLFNGALVATVLSLDSNYMETATRVSQQVFDKLQKIQKTGGWSAKASKNSASWKIPMLSYWWGAGPLIWRQLIGAIRTSRSTLVMGMVVGGALAIPLMANYSGGMTDGPLVLAIVFGALAYITTLFSLQLPMGFRAEAEHIEVLKALPIRPLPVAVGQLAGAVFAITFLQWLVIVVALIATQYHSVWWAVGAVSFVPFNVLVFSISDCLFLLYPLRAARGTRDFQTIARMVLFAILQMFVVIVCLVLAAIVAGVTYLITESVVVAFFPAFAVLLVMAMTGLFVLARLYEGFDVSSI